MLISFNPILPLTALLITVNIKNFIKLLNSTYVQGLTFLINILIFSFFSSLKLCLFNVMAKRKA